MNKLSISKGILFSLLACALILGIAEAGLRVAGYRGNAFSGMRFGQDPRSQELFIQDPDLGWALRPEADLPFLGHRTVTDSQGHRVCGQRPDRGPKILCLGDSSTFGWRTACGDAFPSLLQKELERCLGPVRVVNAGVPGYTSDQIRASLPGLLREVNPALVIVYAGNNECTLVPVSDRERREKARGLAGLKKFLGHFRLYRLLRNLLTKNKPFRVEGDLDRSDLASLSSRVPPSDYQENLSAIADMSREHGARVILATVPVNPAAPFVWIVLPPDARAAALVRAAVRALDIGQPGTALSLAEKALEITPDHYLPLYCKARALRAQGKPHSLEAYQKALEQHPFPNRQKPSYNRILRQTAHARNIPLADLAQRFENTPGFTTTLLMDACHPTPQGHELIAQTLAPLACELLEKKKKN